MRYRTPEEMKRHNTYMRKWRTKNLERGREVRRRSAKPNLHGKRSRDILGDDTFAQKKRRIWAQVKIAERCGICSRRDHPAVLAWHHINPETKVGRGDLDLGKLSWQRGLEEILKCEVLCLCCHALRHEEMRGAEQRSHGGDGNSPSGRERRITEERSYDWR